MANEFKEIKEVTLEPIKREPFAPLAIFMLIAILPFLSMVSYLITSSITDKESENFDKNFIEQIEIVTKNKAYSIDKWLDNTVLIARRITNSRVVQTFSVDINEASGNNNLSGNSRQLLYMQEILSNFVYQNKLIEAHLINRRANEYVRSSNAKGLPENYAQYARDVFTSRKPKYSPLRVDGESMLIDVYVPILSLKAEENTKKIEGKTTHKPRRSVVGVLAMTMQVKDFLKDIMQQNLNSLEGQEIYLFQEVSGGVAMVRLNDEHQGIFTQDKDTDSLDIYKRAWSIYYLEKNGKYDLTKIPKFGSQSNILPRKGEILMVKEKVNKLPLVVMTVLELRETYKNFVVKRRQLQIIGQLIALMVFVVFLAFWWRHQEVRQRMLTEQYQGFANKVNSQRNLLLNINKAVDEHIGLKYFDGKYVYVNEAFAKFFNLSPKEIIGHNDIYLYGEKIGHELEMLDKELLKNKQHVFEEKSFIIRDKRHHLEISKTPFLDGNNRFVGIIVIIKDVTEIVRERLLREKAMKNSMRSMMRIMERYDQHLVKHAKYLKRFTLDVAKKLNLASDEVMTLEICANLSQLGKIYVPLEILTSNEPLNDQDLLTYRTHIENTAYILDTVDWGLPVVKTIYAMHEHLDGTGYPNGLGSPDISKLSRILGVCNVFCKLIAPRHGHKIYTPEEAIKFMVNEKGKYDLAVIQVLAELLNEDESIILAC